MKPVLNKHHTKIITEGLLRLSERKAVLFEIRVNFPNNAKGMVRRVNCYIDSIGHAEEYVALLHPLNPRKIIVQRKDLNND